MYSPVEILHDIQAEAQNCHACSLRSTCQQVVFGEGNPEADLMLVGEGPGGDEDRIGKPFVGAAGQLLDKILKAAEFEREEVYIANIVKCRPPKNRTPKLDEMQCCLPWLEAQIAAVQPKIIVCLGSVAAKALIDVEVKITRIRGKWSNLHGMLLMPTFHPSALLRDEQKKRPVWEDFKKVRAAYLSIGLHNERRG